MTRDAGREIPRGSPLHRYFLRITRSTLRQLSLEDDEIIFYLTELLTHFALADNLYKLRGATGDRILFLTDMLLEIEESTGRRRREIQKHIGDYSLFVLGLFPEHLKRPRRPDSRGFYLAQGKKSYRSVAEIDRYRPTAPLFRKLSDRFEQCVAALNLGRAYFWDPASQYICRQMGW